MKVKAAAVQPLGYFGDEEYLNAGLAASYVDIAAAQGAQLVVFPEGYPGPYSGPMDSCGKLDMSPMDLLCRKAKEHGVYIYAGCAEPNPEYEDTWFVSHKFISPDGKVIKNYRRSHPTHPILNEAFLNGKMHIAPGEELPVVDTEIGKIGLCICSEIWAPEVPRVLTLKGAQIILAPGGGAPVPIRSRIRENWHVIAAARAIENVVYVVMDQIYHESVGGLGRTAMFGPEKALGTLTTAGVLIAEFDLDRINEIRNRYFDEDICSAPNSERDLFYNRPGQVYDRRPELYGPLTEMREESFDYHYYKRGLDSYKEEYERVKDFDYWEGGTEEEKDK